MAELNGGNIIRVIKLTLPVLIPGEEKKFT